MITREYPSWIELTTAANATATATRTAAAVGQSHYVTSISGSFEAAVGGATLILNDGATEIGRWHVYDSFSKEFPSPIKIDAGNATSLVLAASGTIGIDGSAVLTGYTL